MVRSTAFLKACLLALAAARAESHRRIHRPTSSSAVFRNRRIPRGFSIRPSSVEPFGIGRGGTNNDAPRQCAWEHLRGGSGYYGNDDDGPSRDRYYDEERSNPPRSGGYDRYGRADANPAPTARQPYQEDPWNRNDEDDAKDEYYSYDYEDEYQRKRVDSGSQTTSRRPSLLPSALPSILRTGDKRIGLLALGAGAAITMLGMSLFFNKTLMRLGNLLVIAGVPLTLGPTRVAGYFIQPQKARATACLALGIFLVFIGWPVVGIVLEVFGLLNLFGNLFPVVMALAKQMPVVGTVLGAGGSGNRRSNGPSRRDRYYEDDEDDYYDGQQRDRRPRDDDRYY